MPSVKSKIKRDPERWVANWLEDLDVTFDYEREMGGKNPDFLIPYDEPPRAAIEVEELHFSKEEAKEYRRKVEEANQTGNGWSGGHDPFPPIREKINMARKQLRGCKGLPCLLVLYDATGQRCLHDSWVIFGAMLGSPAIRIPLAFDPTTGKPIPHSGEAESIWGSGGKMINYHRMEPQNTTISAIGVLSWKPVLQHRFGTDSEYKEPCVDIYQNPFAAVDWPDDLVGSNDSLWAWHKESSQISKLRDGLARITPKRAERKSRNQIDIEAIMNSPLFRNEQ